MIQAAQFLNETGAGTKTIIIFSDMQEELDKVTVRDFPIDLKNIRVVAVNVVKLKTDNVDPRRYLGRLEAWQKRVEGAGAARVARDQRPREARPDPYPGLGLEEQRDQRVRPALRAPVAVHRGVEGRAGGQHVRREEMLARAEHAGCVLSCSPISISPPRMNTHCGCGVQCHWLRKPTGLWRSW